jgi:hypothetical protein
MLAPEVIDARSTTFWFDLPDILGLATLRATIAFLERRASTERLRCCDAKIAAPQHARLSLASIGVRLLTKAKHRLRNMPVERRNSAIQL